MPINFLHFYFMMWLLIAEPALNQLDQLLPVVELSTLDCLKYTQQHTSSNKVPINKTAGFTENSWVSHPQALVSFKKYMPYPSSLSKEEEGSIYILNETNACARISKDQPCLNVNTKQRSFIVNVEAHLLHFL